jgi:hypothetical protein
VSAVLDVTVTAMQTDPEWDHFSELVLWPLIGGLWDPVAAFTAGLAGQGLGAAALFIIGCAVGSNPSAALSNTDILRSLLLESLVADDPVAVKACVVRKSLWEAMGEEVREAVKEVVAA